MRNKRLIISVGLSLLAILIFGRFFIGVYHHREFPEEHLFIKSKPTWKWYFYSPIGESDLTMDDLNNDQKLEEKYFNDFVEKNHGR